ncbi:MAG: tetratricopeptide repeat protein [Bacteroidales bacterium]
MDNEENNYNFQQFEKIEKFLLNELSDPQKRAFENELAQSKSLQKEVEQFKLMIRALEKEGMREKIGEFHKNTIESKKPQPDSQKAKPALSIPRAVPYLVAASVLILLGIGLFRFFSPSFNNEKIFSEFFEPDPGLITPMSARSDYLFYDGMIDYKLKDYKSAISKWEELKGEFAGTDTLNYFLGVAHLTLENDEQAIGYLNEALQAPNNEFIHETRYYLGLAYLKQGKINEAVELFEESEIVESKLVLKRLNK